MRLLPRLQRGSPRYCEFGHIIPNRLDSQEFLDGISGFRRFLLPYWQQPSPILRSAGKFLGADCSIADTRDGNCQKVKR